MFDKKLKNIADAVAQVLGLEEIDPNKRTKDTTKGQEPTKQKDDVGPGSDGKSTKVKYRPGPLNTEGFKEKLFNSLTEEKLDEANEEMLARYMNSRGYNPETTPKDKKIAITKSNEFKKWLNDHQFEETEYDSEEYLDEELDEMINEVLSKDATAGDWIHDFVHSDNPKFKGKSKEKRKKMALAAYYAHQREEVELEETSQVRPQGGSRRNYGDSGDQGFKPGVPVYPGTPMKAKDAKKDMAKTLAKVFSKEGVDLEEGKQPETDSVPWVGDAGKDTPEVITDKSGGQHTPMSRAKHLARIALKKVKKEVVGEEAEQVNEISAGLASRYLSKKHDRDYEKTGEHTSSLKKTKTLDQAFKDGKNSVRALRIIQKKKVK